MKYYFWLFTLFFILALCFQEAAAGQSPLAFPEFIAQFSEAGVEQFKVAVNAPDFTLRKLGGGDLSLKDLKGRVVILNFFATY